MRLRSIIPALLLALAASFGAAQSVNLIAANTKDLAGHPFTGKFCIQPANNNGSVINFQYGNGGQGVTRQMCYQVTAGALQSGVQVPDTYITNPQNLCLYATLVDPTQSPLKQVVSTFPCLQPASSGQSWCSTVSGVTTCDLDNYAPLEGSLVVQQTGIQGPSGTVTVGNVQAGSQLSITNSGTGSAAVLNFTIPVGGDGITEVDTLTGSDFGGKLAACISGVSSTYGGTCDARGLTSAQTIGSSITISASNVTIYLPCTTITTAQQVIV